MASISAALPPVLQQPKSSASTTNNSNGNNSANRSNLNAGGGGVGVKLPRIPSSSQQPPDSPSRGYRSSSASNNLPLNMSNNNAATAAAATAALEAQPKILNIEGQRILSVLQEAMQKLLLIQVIPDSPDRRLSNVLGEENISLLHDFRNAEIKYNGLYEKTLQNIRAEAASNPNSIVSPSKIQSVNVYTPELKDEGKKLRVLTRHLCRLIYTVPNFITKLSTCPSTKLDSLDQFIELWKQHVALIQEKLQTTVEEDIRKQEQLSHVTAKERKALEEIHQLEIELEKAKIERQAEISKRNDTIRRLKDQLKDIKTQAEENAAKLETRSKQKEESDIGQFREKERILRPEIQSLAKQLKEMQITHQEEEANLRKKKFKIETEVENWIHKYDQEMEEKQNEIEETIAIYREEKAQLEELEQRFSELKKEYDRINEEKQAAAEEAKRQEEFLQKQNKAATRIQSIWRGYKCRKDIKKSRSAKSAKSSGSGKKKKK